MAEEYFSRLRRAEIGIHHHIAGAYLLRYAHESSWREDKRRVSNGDQVSRVAALAMKRGKSVAGERLPEPGCWHTSCCAKLPDHSKKANARDDAGRIVDLHVNRRQLQSGRGGVQAALILAAGHSKKANARDDARRIVELHIGANRATINPAAVAFSPYAAICKAASLNPGTRLTATMWSVLADLARKRVGGTVHPLRDTGLEFESCYERTAHSVFRISRRHMKFVLVNGRTPRTQSFWRCAVSRSGRATYGISRPSSHTAITSATSITAKFPSLHSNIVRWHHDNPRLNLTLAYTDVRERHLKTLAMLIFRDRTTEQAYHRVARLEGSYPGCGSGRDL